MLLGAADSHGQHGLRTAASVLGVGYALRESNLASASTIVVPGAGYAKRTATILWTPPHFGAFSWQPPLSTAASAPHGTGKPRDGIEAALLSRWYLATGSADARATNSGMDAGQMGSLAQAEPTASRGDQAWLGQAPLSQLM